MYEKVFCSSYCGLLIVIFGYVGFRVGNKFGVYFFFIYLYIWWGGKMEWWVLYGLWEVWIVCISWWVLFWVLGILIIYVSCGWIIKVY